jgi:hypothetical protein
MRLRQYIHEEWYKRIKNRSKSVEVFKDPERKEFKEVSGELSSIRFIADKKTKTLYIWDVYGMIHSDMYKKLYTGDFNESVGKGLIIPGVADVLKSGKAIMYSSDWLRELFLGYDSISDIDEMVKNFKWLKSIKIDRYFKDLKDDVNDRQDLTQFNKGL